MLTIFKKIVNEEFSGTEVIKLSLLNKGFLLVAN